MKRRFDIAIGRVTMYRLVTLWLILLAIVSLILSATGILFFSPLELAAGLVVAVGVSVGSNRLVALLFGATPHTESGVITGLLLFFIFRPSIEPLDLLGTAVAALVATLSKYLVAVRGRHIVNPAAFGAVVVGITGIGVSWWWIGSTALLPVVVAAAVLVLYRTRRFLLAGTFIVVGVGSIVPRLIDNDMSLAAAITTSFTSYPVIFFAAFMLTEPLTLPPRRWQQVIEAALVGVLFALPYEIGPIFSTPELALVAGNLLAFVAGQRRGIRLVLESRTRLTPTAVELRFRPESALRFAAGQYLELTVPHRGADARGDRRMFSIATAPADRTVAVAYRENDPGSSFKAALARVEPGHTIRATGVWGDFTLPSDPTVPVLFVAAGIGITPFVSQIADLHRRGQARDIVLVYAVSAPEEIAYRTELELLGVPVFLTAPEPPDVLPTGWAYLGPGRLTAARLAGAVGDLRERAALISGPPGLVDELRPALGRRAKTDYFSGY
ncbi:ferredoxin-NADP reductase [Mycetocola sp. CAN_C7]|uniref:ferredoxin--NADP reductase n=1 Tax=Mycetocola sp. CAN_C7 TaxID=2787724 RepID=UPI0018CB85CD